MHFRTLFPQCALPNSTQHPSPVTSRSFPPTLMCAPPLYATPYMDMDRSERGNHAIAEY